MAIKYRGTEIMGEKPFYSKDEYGTCYEYRGFSIEKDEYIKSGNYGSYKSRIKGSMSWFWSLSDALQSIDRQLGVPKEVADSNKELIEELEVRSCESLESECDLAIEKDYTFLVCFSGGKDSIAMVLNLLDKGVEKNRIILHHHDVDGGINLFDWKVTTEYCTAFASAFDLEILFSYRQGGILREIHRKEEGLQDVYYQSEMNGEYHILKSREGNSTRRKFPAVAANLRTRWCSSVVKIDVLSRVISNNPNYREGKFIICTGERREESKNRSKYKIAELYRSNSKKRRAIQLRPILDWTETKVWDIIKKYKVQPHPCYELGWSRCSCQTCIFSSSDVWASVDSISPEKIVKFLDTEIEINHTVYNGMNINQKVSKGTSFISSSKYMIDQATVEFTMPIIVKDWQYPKGAFGEGSCGSL